MIDADLMAKLIIGAYKGHSSNYGSYGVGLGIEFVFAGLRKHSINEGFLVSGMLIPDYAS